VRASWHDAIAVAEAALHEGVFAAERHDADRLAAEAPVTLQRQHRQEATTALDERRDRHPESVAGNPRLGVEAHDTVSG
jgi:hypothetical protein